MTDYTDLIARLRKYSKQLLPCTHEAADALEAQARRIAELEREIACSIVSGNDAHEQALGYVYELNAAAARIAELEAALLPFAVIADESTANLADNYMYSDCYPMSAFRAAKAALEKKND